MQGQHGAPPQGIHAVNPGASDVRTVDGGAHAPVDRARPRWEHPIRFAPFEGAVVDVSDPDVRVVSGSPEARMHDPIIAGAARPATVPQAFTVREGFEDGPGNQGNRGALQRVQARADDLQSMERVEAYRRNTIRVTPTAWDEKLIVAGEGRK